MWKISNKIFQFHVHLHYNLILFLFNIVNVPKSSTAKDEENEIFENG